jgi:hypothetical protein
MIPAGEIATALLLVADAVSTDQALRAGRTEANPVLRKVLGAHPPLSIALLWRAAVFTLIHFFGHIPPLGWWLFVPVLTWVVAHNLGLRKGKP